MKALDRYILEKFQITKDSKYPYSCQPKDKFELRKILEKRLAKDKDADLNDIDVSQITDIGFLTNEGLFEGLDPHNIEIDKWDVSKVKDMDNMFYNCENFNCDLSKWDVRNVEHMDYMFRGCKNFNGNLDQWDIRNVKNMSAMFLGCKKFTGEGLERWKPIKCRDMRWMFDGCDSLKNKPSWYHE